MKPEPTSHAPNRRDFLRNAALTGILGLAGTLVVRSAGHKCVNQGICRGCFAYDDCNLPQALSAKQVLGSRNELRS